MHFVDGTIANIRRCNALNISVNIQSPLDLSTLVTLKMCTLVLDEDANSMLLICQVFRKLCVQLYRKHSYRTFLPRYQ